MQNPQTPELDFSKIAAMRSRQPGMAAGHSWVERFLTKEHNGGNIVLTLKFISFLSGASALVIC
jgi:hypothetical protein